MFKIPSTERKRQILTYSNKAFELMKKNDKSKKDSFYFREGEIIFNMTNQNRNLGIMVKTGQDQRIQFYQPEKVTIHDNELSACFSNFMPDKSIWIHI